MGLKSRRKGRAFEQKIARELRVRWPDVVVRRASQAERAYEPDVFVQGGPSLFADLWLELHDARNPRVLDKLEQAERDSGSREPIVIWHRLGERTIQATMRADVFAWLAYDQVRPEWSTVITVDFESCMQLIDAAARREA